MAAYDDYTEGNTSLFDVPGEMDAQRILAQTVRRNPALSMPTGGMPTRRAAVAPAPTQMPPAPPADTNSEPMPPAPAAQKTDFNSLMERYNEMAHQRPDTTAYAEAAKRRAERSDRDMIVSIALAGKGGDNFRPLAQTLGAHAVKESGDYDIPGGWGTVSPSGEVAWNSAKLQENDLNRLKGLMQIQQSREAAAATLAERTEARRAQQQIAGAMAAIAQGNQDLRRDQLNQGKFVKVKGDDGNEMIFNTQTREWIRPGAAVAPDGGASGAPGAPTQFPAHMNPKATEAERGAGYQTEAIAARQRVIDPKYQAPGALEAFARTALPGEVGEGVANFLSPAERQIARGAQEGTVDALLYLATGAAYNKEQLTQARREFLAGYLDKNATVEMKRQRVAELAIAARNRAGRAWTQTQENKLQAAFPEIAGAMLKDTVNTTPRSPSALPKATVRGRAEGYMNPGR